MKPGLQVGQTAQVRFQVTPAMFAGFDGHVIHPILSTSSLVHQMEWAARKTILPYLESEEEGMGAKVDVHHMMLTPKGVEVTVVATVSAVHGNKVECEVEAHNWRGKVAKAKVVQAIMPREWIAEKTKEIELVEEIRQHEKN